MAFQRPSFPASRPPLRFDARSSVSRPRAFNWRIDVDFGQDSVAQMLEDMSQSSQSEPSSPVGQSAWDEIVTLVSKKPPSTIQANHRRLVVSRQSGQRTPQKIPRQHQHRNLPSPCITPSRTVRTNYQRPRSNRVSSIQSDYRIQSQRRTEKIKELQDKLHGFRKRGTTTERQPNPIMWNSREGEEFDRVASESSSAGEFYTPSRPHVQYEQGEIAVTEHFDFCTSDHLVGRRELETRLKQNWVDKARGGGLGGIEGDEDLKTFIREARFLPGRPGWLPGRNANV